jgi:hypothetical protein
MALVRGPFSVKYGANVLAGIDSDGVSFDYTVATDEQSTIQGKAYQVTGAHNASVDIQFLETDVPALAVVLPQYYVPNGGTLSTGEVVNSVDGAIEIIPSECGEDADKTDFILTSCNGHVLRLVDCTTNFTGIEIDGNVRKVTVKFTGESDAGTLQLFKEGAVSIVS